MNKRDENKERKMSKKAGILSIVLCIIAIGLSVFALVMVFTKEEPKKPEQVVEEEADIQYVLYLGTNDKDTNQPVYGKEEAKEKAISILIDHFGGYTIQEANGGWIDDGTIYQEYTLVIYLSDTDMDKVHAASDKLIEEFHQSSILIQANKTKTEFYEGNK